MVHVPDELIMAYADGQVSPEEKAWLDGILAVDPAVRSRLDVFLVTGPGQFSAFDSVLAAPVPSRLVDTVMGKKVEATKAKAKTAAGPQGPLDRLFPNGFGLMPAMGYAAVLLVGVGVGSTLMPATSQETPLVVADRDGFVASGRLQVALDTERSGNKDLINEGDIRPVLTLRDTSGRVCRHYEIVGRKKGPQGLACREENGNWRITVLTGGEDAASARTASQGQSEVLDGVIGAAIKSMSATSELSTAEELYLIEKGWTGPPAMQPDGARN